MGPIRTLACAVAVGGLALAGPLVAAAPAHAASAPDPQAAAQLAVDHGYRTGVAVLDLTTGQYTGGGDDAGLFPSESVIKIAIATQLLLSGQMHGQTEALARTMIAASDDPAADLLYLQAGGESVLPSVAQHYGIADLGTPTATPGHWGLTQISAKGLVHLYAAIARDPAVYPWLSGAMAGALRTASDGTDQGFGLPAAVSQVAVKQGWGHDGVGGGRAVANTTGYVSGGRLAVAILTEGPPSSYVAGIAAEVTAQAQTLFAGGVPAAPAAPAAPSAAAPAAGAAQKAAAAEENPQPSTGLPPGLLVVAGIGGAAGIAFGAHRTRQLLRARRQRRRARQAALRRKRALAAAARSGAVIVKLPDGRLVRVTSSRPRPTRSGPVRAPAAAVHGRAPATRPAVAVPA
jgi:Beta-lactamase enzyme family